MSENPKSDADQALVRDLADGKLQALADLFGKFHARLWKIAHFRMSHRISGRVDADDILQECYVNAQKRLHYFDGTTDDDVFLWLRWILNQTLIDVHRKHLRTRQRSAKREQSLTPFWDGDSTSTSLSFHLAGKLTAPSQAAAKAELVQQLQVATEELPAIDQEIIALRHFEELTNSEAARVLELSEQAASIRYVRAMKRLSKILEKFPDFQPPPEDE